MRTFLCVVVVICLLPLGSAHAVTGAHALRSYPHRNAVKVNVQTSIGISYNEALDTSALDGGIVVSGSKNGVYSGSLTLSVDCKTLIFKPSHTFLPGETVSVSARSLHLSGDGFTSPEAFTFTTATKAPPEQIYNSEIPEQPLSIPDTGTLPKITVTKNLKPYPGQIYFANIFDPSGIGYRIRVNTDGTIAFAKRTPYFATDYKANPNGTYSWVNSWLHHVYIADTSDKIIDSVTGANGFPVDIHEFRYTPEGNFMIIADDVVDTDMSQVIPGGNKSALVTFPVIQEFDKKHNLIFQWDSKDYFSILDGTDILLTAANIDFCHMNSLEFDTDSNIVASCRNMDEVTKIDRHTGQIIWRMGGYNNSFTFLKDIYGFTGQHHFRRLPNGNFTGFDDGNFRPGPSQFSRAIEYKLDEDNLTATEVWEFRHNPDRFASGMGSVQRLPNGSTGIGWGFADTVGYTEVDSLGNTQFELNFGPGTHSYRVYKFDANYITSGLVGIISSGDLDFGSVSVGDTIWHTVQIKNTGLSNISVKNSYLLSDTVNFSIDPSTQFPIVIKPGASAEILVYFHPQSVQTYNDSIIWSTEIPQGSDVWVKDRSYLKGQATKQLGVTASPADNAFTISPNPADGNSILISTTVSAQIHSLSIYDMLGKEIYRKEISGLLQIQIPIQDLPGGIYYVKLNSKNGTSIQRFSRVR